MLPISLIVFCFIYWTVNSLKIVDRADPAIMQYNKQYGTSIFKRFLGGSKPTENDSLCSLPVEDQENLCSEITAAFYGLSNNNFKLKDDVSMLPSFDCVEKTIITQGSNAKSSKTMYRCPTKDMDIMVKRFISQDLYVFKGKLPGSLFVAQAEKTSNEVNIVAYINDVDYIYGNPIIERRDEDAENYFQQYWSENKKLSLSKSKIMSIISKKNNICGLPTDQKFKLCYKLVKKIYNVEEKELIHKNSASEESKDTHDYSCKKENIYLLHSAENRYQTKPFTKKNMYMCPIHLMEFQNKPIHLNNWYVTDGDNGDSVFIVDEANKLNNEPTRLVIKFYITKLVFLYSNKK